MNDFLIKQQRLHDASARKALILFYKAITNLGNTLNDNGVRLEGATKDRFEELKTQLKSDMWDAGISQKDLNDQ
jgi:hypothetical protein